MNTVEWQTLAIVLVSIVSAVTGWWCKTLWNDLKAVSENLNKVQVDLPMNYVRRTDFENQIIRLEKNSSDAVNRIERSQHDASLRMEAKMDKIIEALDKKQDK